MPRWPARLKISLEGPRTYVPMTLLKFPFPVPQVPSNKSVSGEHACSQLNASTILEHSEISVEQACDVSCQSLGPKLLGEKVQRASLYSPHSLLLFTRPGISTVQLSSPGEIAVVIADSIVSSFLTTFLKIFDCRHPQRCLEKSLIDLILKLLLRIFQMKSLISLFGYRR